MMRTQTVVAGAALAWLLAGLVARDSAAADAPRPQYVQTRPFPWSSFGVVPAASAAAAAGADLAAGPWRVRRQTAPKKKKKETPAKKRQAALECLAAHNRLRRLHNVPELEWDNKLAAFAQKRSDHIAASDGAEFGHPADLPFGENLFWHSSADTSCEHMVRSWYDEISQYDFKAPSFAPATGHFTQLVWRGTARVGCAFAASSGPRGGLFLTCNYDPPGNFVGEFVDNVPRPASGAQPSVLAAGPRPAPGALSTTPAAPSAPAERPATTKKPKKRKPKKKKSKRRRNKKKNSTNTSTSTTTVAPRATGPS